MPHQSVVQADPVGRSSRIQNAAYAAKLVSAEQAAALISNGDHVAASGFTGSGYPKAVPAALARRAHLAHERGEDFQVSLWTGASTAPEMDGALARADALSFRMPFQTDHDLRRKINDGDTEYVDVHLGSEAALVRSGAMGRIDVAIIEVTAITENGALVPSSSIGNNKTWLERADRVILEVNDRQPAGLEGMADIPVPPDDVYLARPLNIVRADDRIGDPYLHVDPAKVVAVVETSAPDRANAFAQPDDMSRSIAGYVIDFLRHEVEAGRVPPNLWPLQSGVGNVANAVMAGLSESEFHDMQAYTETIQDGMLALVKDGTIRAASTSAFSLSPAAVEEFDRNIDFYRQRIVLRPQEISNSGEVIHRLKVIAVNGMVEADLFGNVNSTHRFGTEVLNGIGGSNDFSRNAGLSFFVSASTAKGGAISCIVPGASHIDHTEHDTQIIVTEQGLADLRGLAPIQRARVMIEKCAHPDYRPALEEYLDRAVHMLRCRHEPVLLGEQFDWHLNFQRTGQMVPELAEEEPAAS